MVKQGYKQTEIGVIPEDWDCAKFGEKVKIYRGGSPRPIQNYITTSSNGVNWIKIGDVGENDKYIRSTHEKIIAEGVSKSREVHVGDFILSNSMSFGRPYILDIDGCIHDGWLTIQDYKNTFATEYLYYLLSSDQVYQQYLSMAAGSSVKNLNKDKVSALNVIYPKIPEQKRIAEALSDVDSMISSLEKLIAKKKAVKQGAMQELLTGKKRLPGFIGEWYETTIGEHCCVFDGTHQTPKYTLAGIPFYSVENVTANDFVNTKFITTEEHEQLSSKCKIEKGDILMTRIGSIGDCKYIDWDVNASFYVSLALIKCKETINAQFLSFYSTSSYFKKEIEIRSLLTAIPQKINLGPISEIRLNIPSDIKEQEAIASILSDMDNEIEALEQKLAKTRQIKQGMMQQLLTGKIRLV